jgi:DNA-directed RNA polymerase specialized sigma24 family protein
MPEQLDDAEIRRRLERAMGKVPRTTREVFLAHRLDDMPYRETTERTGAVRATCGSAHDARHRRDRSSPGPSAAPLV